MTDDELREAAVAVHGCMGDMRYALPILRALVERETEACAGLCDKASALYRRVPASLHDGCYAARAEAANTIAAAIRARSK